MLILLSCFPIVDIIFYKAILHFFFPYFNINREELDQNNRANLAPGALKQQLCITLEVFIVLSVPNFRDNARPGSTMGGYTTMFKPLHTNCRAKRLRERL